MISNQLHYQLEMYSHYPFGILFPLSKQYRESTEAAPLQVHTNLGLGRYCTLESSQHILFGVANSHQTYSHKEQQ